MKRLLLFVLLSCITVICDAQNVSFPVPDTIRISSIAQEEGLSQLNVLSFDFDENGYLWAGTEDGLNRFNGYNMKVFSQNTEGSWGLTDDHIRGLLFENDTLWLGTNTHSIQAYLPTEDKFINFNRDDKLPPAPSLNYCHKIFRVNERFLLVSTVKNCILIDKTTGEFFVVPLPNPTVNDYVISITARSENGFWLGTYLNGIVDLNLKTKEIKETSRFNSFKNTPVHVLQKGRSSELFIGTEKGLFHYNETAGTIKPINGTEEHAIRCFYNWNDDFFLIGYGQGLMFLNKTTHQTSPVVLSGYKDDIFSPVEITQIKQDFAQGIWMATQAKGLLYYHPSRQKFTPKRINLPEEPEKDFISVFNFLRDDETLWMATHIGFVKHELGTNSYKLYRTNNLGYTIVEDKKSDIWGGGFNQGLAKYNEEKDLFIDVTSRTNIQDRDIAEITPLSRDSIWVSTWSSGIYSVNPETYDTHPVQIDGKDLHRSRTSYVGRDNSIWLGADSGLYRIKNADTTKYKHSPTNNNSLSNDRIFSITEDNKNNLWVGTAKGLNKINLSNDNVTQYLQQPGLPNDFIYGVVSDKNGDIWVSTNSGLSRLNVQTEKFINFTEKDGLQNNEFNGKAAYKDSLGYLYFGGMNGFNVFHPDSIPVNSYVGKTVIEDVELFGSSVDKNIIYTDTLVFSHHENVLTFIYASLNFLLPEKNRYQFKMEGFDKEWRPVTSERSTTYTNLNPGTYIFQVRGSNNDLIWGSPDSLTLIIKAPWYETPLFRILLALAIIMVVTSFFLYRYNQKKAENLRLQRMVEGRTEELSKSNRDLSDAISVAKEQKENISFLMQELNHRVKNNLQLIATLLDIQKESTADELTRNNLQTAQNRLFTIATVHDLLNTSKPEENFRLDEFITKLANELILFMDADVQINFDLSPLEINKKSLTPLGIIINELVTNTLKHAFTPSQKGKRIKISLSRQDSYLLLIYHDNGRGIPSSFTEKENSLGLNLIRNLALQLKGEMEIIEGKGTTINVRFKK